jgi:nicotinate phosphoribosyltransferase
MVYKLVARATDRSGPLEDVAKSGGDKATVGGRKVAWRKVVNGVATTEVLAPWGSPTPPDARALQAPLILDGDLVDQPDLEAARAHHRAAMAELSADAASLHATGPGIPTLTVDGPARDDNHRPLLATKGAP